MRLFVGMLCAIIASAAQAQEQQPIQGGGGCANTIFGMACPPPGGTLTKNMFGDAVCGGGQCMKNMGGDIVCARQPGGYVTKNMFGDVVCVGGCEQPSLMNCQSPR